MHQDGAPHFLRQRSELVVVPPEHRPRPFNEMVVEARLLERGSAQFLRRLSERPQHQPPSLVRIEHHEPLPETVPEGPERIHGEGRSGRPHPRPEPVPAAPVPRHHRRTPRHLDPERNDRAVEERHDPADRPSEGKRRTGDARVPVHRLREHKPPQRSLDDRRQEFGGRAARNLRLDPDIRPAIRFEDVQSVRRFRSFGPDAPGEPEGGAGPLSVFGASHPHRRTQLSFDPIRLTRGDPLGARHQSPRGPRTLYRSGRNRRFLEPALDAGGETGDQAVQPLGRKFLAADLDQEFSGVHASPPC